MKLRHGLPALEQMPGLRKGPEESRANLPPLIICIGGLALVVSIAVGFGVSSSLHKRTIRRGASVPPDTEAEAEERARERVSSVRTYGAGAPRAATGRKQATGQARRSRGTAQRNARRAGADRDKYCSVDSRGEGYF